MIQIRRSIRAVKKLSMKCHEKKQAKTDKITKPQKRLTSQVLHVLAVFDFEAFYHLSISIVGGAAIASRMGTTIMKIIIRMKEAINRALKISSAVMVCKRRKMPVFQEGIMNLCFIIALQRPGYA